MSKTADRDHVLPGLVRARKFTTGLPRIALEDVEIAGVTIPKGDAVFTSPDELGFARHAQLPERTTDPPLVSRCPSRNWNGSRPT